ncbi:hypothetical protein KM043_015985 [Ampulex compressa]|nr:hypothetical protein KM043_015985 [Ampulex compressa]
MRALYLPEGSQNEGAWREGGWLFLRERRQEERDRVARNFEMDSTRPPSNLQLGPPPSFSSSFSPSLPSSKHKTQGWINYRRGTRGNDPVVGGLDGIPIENYASPRAGVSPNF